MKMPTTMLDMIKNIERALKRKDVQADVGRFAVGVLIEQQRKYHQIQRQSAQLLKDQIKVLKMAPGSPAFQKQMAKIKELEAVELGFYYTIYMFSKIEGHKVEIKQMIETLLALDTTGRYLLTDKPIKLDKEPPFFELDLSKILTDYEIDVTVLKDVARKNKANSLKQNELPGIDPGEPLEKQLASMPLRFDLLSQIPNEQNVTKFLQILADLFEHAKMLDCTKLDTLNAKMFPGEKVCAFSTVSFLQNRLSDWMFASLIVADNVELLEQRLQFIMAVFATANPLQPPIPIEPTKPIVVMMPPLPSNATADMYMPFFIISRYIEQKLSDHPAVKPYLAIIKAMNKLDIAEALSNYTDRIFVVRGNHPTPLEHMRMLMTTLLDRNPQIAEYKSYLMSHLFHFVHKEEPWEKLAREALNRGRAVLTYFNPERKKIFEPISPASKDVQDLYDAQCILGSLFSSLFKGLDGTDLMELAVSKINKLEHPQAANNPQESMHDHDDLSCFSPENSPQTSRRSSNFLFKESAFPSKKIGNKENTVTIIVDEKRIRSISLS